MWSQVRSVMKVRGVCTAAQTSASWRKMQRAGLDFFKYDLTLIHGWTFNLWPRMQLLAHWNFVVITVRFLRFIWTVMNFSETVVCVVMPMRSAVITALIRFQPRSVTHSRTLFVKRKSSAGRRSHSALTSSEIKLQCKIGWCALMPINVTLSVRSHKYSMLLLLLLVVSYFGWKNRHCRIVVA